MSVTEAKVPISFLLSREFSTTTKVVAIVLWMDEKEVLAGRPVDRRQVDRRLGDSQLEFGKDLSPTRLAKRTGFSRSTVYQSLRTLSASNWISRLDFTPRAKLAGKKRPHRLDYVVNLPKELIIDGTIGAQARILYGLLQGLPGYYRGKGSFTYRSLGSFVQKSPKTMASAIQQLKEAGWIELEQSGRKSPYFFKLCNPIQRRAELNLKAVQRRIHKAPFLGESLMREYLSLIVDSDEFEDDAAPGFLVNPLADERLQFDRFYPPNTAFEFNGPQHYGPTEIYSAEVAAKQRARDLMKMGICSFRDITLVVVHPEDLSYRRMQKKVGTLLPQRTVDAQSAVLRYLETVSRSYKRMARRVKYYHFQRYERYKAD